MVCPDFPARTTTAMKFPALLFEGNARVEELIMPASFPACCTSLMGLLVVVTVKPTPLLARPPTVTTTLPEVAAEGTGTVMLVSLQFVGFALVLLKVTLLVLWVPPKFTPLMVTEVPTGPDVGLMLFMFGPVLTVKFTLLLTTPLMFTTTGPEVAPIGTGTRICESAQLFVRATMPLKETVLVRVPIVGPKFAPLMVTTAPTGPDVGLMLLI